MSKAIKSNSVATIVNEHVKRAEYAVRGLLPTRAAEIKKELSKNPSAYPFKEIIELNIGNPQIFNTKTISLTRNYLAKLIMTDSNFAKKHMDRSKVHPSLNSELQSLDQLVLKMDPRQKSESSGLEIVRKQVARFIEKRDLHGCDWRNIVITTGASAGIQTIMNLLLQKPGGGIMMSIPQYPLYSATTTIFNSTIVPYYLNEEDNWNIDMDNLREEYDKAVKNGVDVRTIAVINPGNPTGNVFDREKMIELLKFSYERNLVVLADEVYQENILGDKPRYSFKKVLRELPTDMAFNIPLISFHSISKGIFGECGLRSGYYELTNIESDVVHNIHKYERGNSPNIAGQIALLIKSAILASDFEEIKGCKEIMKLTKEEYSEIHEDYKIRAKACEEIFNGTKGMKTAPIEGALYAFPRIFLPEKYIQFAKNNNRLPDTQYCLDLLESKGICTVPGNGFGQKEGTYHFRTTLLYAPNEKFIETCNQMKDFHLNLLEKYS